MIAEMLDDCEREYIQIMKYEVNQDDEDEEDKREFKTKLSVIETEFLNAGEGQDGECGGVILVSADKRIVCDNTLQSRLNLCFEEQLPQIRKIL